MPKWLVHTLRDSKLDAPLTSRTCSGSRHASYASDCYALTVSSLHDVEEPLSFDEAQNSKNWMAAMQSKYDALLENDTWNLCDLPLGKKAIGTKWVYKLKRKPDGEIDRYKARLVAKGYAQQKGIDYEETFAPTCRMTTVRFLCALVAHFGLYTYKIVHVCVRFLRLSWQWRAFLCRLKKLSSSSSEAHRVFVIVRLANPSYHVQIMEGQRETRRRGSKGSAPVAPMPLRRRSARHMVEVPEKQTNVVFAPSDPYSAAMDDMPLKDLFPNMKVRKRSQSKKVEVVEAPSPKNTESEESVRSKLRESLAAALKTSESGEWEQDRGQDFKADSEKVEKAGGGMSVAGGERKPMEHDMLNAEVALVNEKTKGDDDSNTVELVQEEAKVVKEGKDNLTDNKEGPFKRIKLEDSSHQSESPDLLEKVACDIEAELYRHFGGVNKKYKERARSLLFNLKDRSNPELRLRVLAGEITPEILCSMNAEQLASKELSEWRMAKAEEFAQMVVLTETDAEQPRLVKKTHKGEIEVGFEKEDVLTDVVTVGSQQRFALATQQQETEGPIANVEPDSMSVDAETNNEIVEVEAEVLNFSPIRELNLTEGISAATDHTDEVLVLETVEECDTVSQEEEKAGLPAILSLDEFVGSKKVKEPKVSVKGDELELKLGLNDVKPPASLTQTDAVIAPTPTTLKDKFPRKPVPSPNRKPLDPGSMKNGTLSQKDRKKEHKYHEKLWEGSFQLSGSQISPVVALFKSGDGVELNCWPKLIEIKGRVRLDALEKFLQELRLSRTRAVMVIACRVDEGEGERGVAVNALKEAASQYQRGERVGYAEPVPGYELYLFPGGGSSLKLLLEHGYLNADQVSVDEEGILIGFVVCRRSPVPASTSHKSSSHYFSANRHALSAQLDSPTRPTEIQWTGNVVKTSALPLNPAKETENYGTPLAFVNLQGGSNNDAEGKGRPIMHHVGHDPVELGSLLQQGPSGLRPGNAGHDWMRKEAAKDEDADDDLPPGFGPKASTRGKSSVLDDDDDDLPEYDFSAQNPAPLFASMKVSDAGSGNPFNMQTSFSQGSIFPPGQGSQGAIGVYSAHPEAQLNPSGKHPSQFLRPMISQVGGPLDQARPLLLSSSQAAPPLHFHPLGACPPPGPPPGPPPFGMFPPRPQLQGDGTFAVRMPGTSQVAVSNVLHGEGHFNQPPQPRPTLAHVHDEQRTKAAAPLLQSHPAPMLQASSGPGQRKGGTQGSCLWDDDDMPEWCPPTVMQQSDGLQIPPRPSLVHSPDSGLGSVPRGISPLMGGGWQGMPAPPAVPPQGEGRGILQAPPSAMRYPTPAGGSHFPISRPEKFSTDRTATVRPTEPRGFKGGK
ncbi:hypothetical protein L7F22_032206 [Adiantum nelumboides]|nr:hypothetical protein [Adiantum nelumboides]